MQVIIPTYWQRLFRMPPAAAATTTLLQSINQSMLHL
jgi:hypothetical protein